MLSALIGALLGVSGIQFRWRGLLILLGLALVLPVINTALAVQFNPAVESATIDMNPAILGRVTAIQFFTLLFWFAIGAGVHWLFNRRKAKNEGGE